MPIDICTIGGFTKTEGNSVAIKVDDEVVILDMGLSMENYIRFQEDREDIQIKTYQDLLKVDALPDYGYIDDWKDQVKAIVCSHGHLDHIGAIPFAGPLFPNAPIISAPYSIEILKSIIKDEHIQLPNKLISLNLGSSYKISDKITVELINMTHSIAHAAIVVIHTPYGKVMYANDFKLDRQPVLGKKPNFARLQQLGDKGVTLLIMNCLYAHSHTKCPSESVAKEMLKDVMLGVNSEGKAMIVTTFSSHLARLKSIIELGKRLNRKIIFLGRSLDKYVKAAERINLINFTSEIKIHRHRDKVQKILKRIEKEGRDKYLIVCTGHQGEPKAILSRISRGELDFKFKPGDLVIFSCQIIPVEINKENRDKLERSLKVRNIRIFKDVHVSVLPDTEVVINDCNGMKIKEISKIKEQEKKEIKVPAFDPSDLKIKWCNAELIKHQYKGKIFKIKTKSGRNVSITSGHSLFKLEKDKIIPEKGDFLEEGDYLAIPKRFSWHKEINAICIDDYATFDHPGYNIKNNILFYGQKSLCNQIISLTPPFARLLGYYLAEGSAPRHISLVIGKHELELLEDIKNSIQQCFPSNININERGNSLEISFGARALRKLFKKWFGENAKTKKIPKFIFSANKEFKLNFLSAYINGDGNIDKGKKHFRIRIKTASKKLASDLLYLCSQVGICAKFDHVEKGKRRKIGGNKKFTEETTSYVIRIQGIEHLSTLKDYLSSKFRLQIEDKIKKVKSSQQQKYPPETFPVVKLNFNEIIPIKYTSLYNIMKQTPNNKKPTHHISPEVIKKQSASIKGFTNTLLEGDLLFDPITEIKESYYDGEVYDFSVPGYENFIGGFGGIMLHNSGHAHLEDHRDLIEIVKPEQIIPIHAEPSKGEMLADLASKLGFNKTHVMKDGKRLRIK